MVEIVKVLESQTRELPFTLCTVEIFKFLSQGVT